MTKSFMPEDTFKNIVNELAECKIRIPKICICGSGEPLLNKDIVSYLNYFHEKRTMYLPHIELVTNGSLLSHELSREICKYLDRIIISIEGLSDQDYQLFSNVQFDFQHFVDEISYLYDCRSDCEIVCKIHSKAVDSEEKRQKFKDIFAPISTSITIENLVNQWSDFKSIYFSDEDGISRYALDGGLNSIVKRRICCPQPFKTLQIYADGDCIPCCADYQHALCVGNVNEKSIYDIWNGEKMYNLRMNHLTGKRKDQYPCQYCVTPECTDVDDIDDDLEEILSKMKKII